MGPSATYMCPRVAKAPAKGVCVWTRGCDGAWDRGEDRTGRDTRKALQCGIGNGTWAIDGCPPGRGPRRTPAAPGIAPAPGCRTRPRPCLPVERSGAVRRGRWWGVRHAVWGRKKEGGRREGPPHGREKKQEAQAAPSHSLRRPRTHVGGAQGRRRGVFRRPQHVHRGLVQPLRERGEGAR
jgi:hypothetical protein